MSSLTDLPSDVLKHIFNFLSHTQVITLATITTKLGIIIKEHSQEVINQYLNVFNRGANSELFSSLPQHWKLLTSTTELNYIKTVLPSLPPPPNHVAYTRNAGFPHTLPASTSSASDVAFRALLLTSFLTTSMLSTVVPQHLKYLPTIDNQTVATICMGMMMLGLGREAASRSLMGRSSEGGVFTAVSPSMAVASPLKSLRLLDRLVMAAYIRQLKRKRRRNNTKRGKWMRVNNQKRLLYLIWRGDVEKIKRFFEGGEWGGGGEVAVEEEEVDGDPFLLHDVDYTLPISERGGVDIDAFYMSPIMLDESVNGDITDTDIECYNSIPEVGLDNGVANQSRNFDNSAFPPDASRMTSPVLMACQFNRHEVLSYLLDSSGGAADVNSQDSNGWGGGHLVVVNNGVESLKVLIRNRCNLSLESQAGYTPYQMCEKMSMQGGEVWELLRKEGGGKWFTTQGVGEFVGKTVEEMVDSLTTTT